MSTAAVSALPGQPTYATPQEIRCVFEKQRETALRWRTSTAEERIARVERLRDALLANRPSLYEAAHADMHKPPAEVDFTEVMPTVAAAHEIRRKLRRWMKPKKVWPTRIMVGTQAWVRYEPRGRCLIISPWNYPVTLSFEPLADCLAAGNPAILKPTEMTPNISAWISRVVRETFPEEEVACFEGDIPVSTALLDLPFDHIFFTGSPAVGKIVMTAAAKHLASVTLELGGKSPTIIDETADLAAAAETILWGKCLNSGQTCIAPDHVYVHESVKEEFVKRAADVLRARFGATPQAQSESADLAHIVSDHHVRRLAGLLEDAKAKGATPLTGDWVRGRFIAPTLLESPPLDSEIMREEIFGPLLPILPFRDLDEVIRQVNDRPKPLALYVWTQSEANAAKVLERTSSGGACVNHNLVQFGHGNLPFGGVNNSGLGNSHGWYGFRTFSHERAVVRTRFPLIRNVFPPYTERVRRFVRWTIDSFRWF